MKSRTANRPLSPEQMVIGNIATLPAGISAELNSLRDPTMMAVMGGLVAQVTKQVHAYCLSHPLSAGQRRMLTGLAASNDERFSAVRDASLDTAQMSEIDMRNALHDAHRPVAVVHFNHPQCRR